MSYDEELFKGAVQALEALIPEELQDKQYETEYDAATIQEENFEYEYGGPLPLGRPESPLMDKVLGSELRYPIPYKKDEDGNIVIDWSNPHIRSPKLRETENVNWFTRFYAAFNMFVRLGVAVRRVSRG